MTEDEPAPLSPEWRKMLVDSGTHPAVIYAMQQCGFVVHPENLAQLSAAQRRAWQRAIERWFEENDPGGDPTRLAPA